MCDSPGLYALQTQVLRRRRSGLENWAVTYRVRLRVAVSSGMQLFSEPLKLQRNGKGQGEIYALWRRTNSKCAENTTPVQWVKWSTSWESVCEESLTQTTLNSPITLLHRPALASHSRPIISTFPLPRPFLFSLDALPVPGKGRRQSIARLCPYRSVVGPCGNLRSAHGEMFYRFVISRLTTLIPSCWEKLTERSSFFNP